MMRRTGSGLTEAGWITLALLVVAMAWDASALDLPFAGLAGSASGFAMRDSWLLATMLHEGGRLLAWLLAVLLCIGAWFPFGPLTRIGPGQRLQLATSTLVGALAVSLLKTGSHTSCPWELADFGGLAHYVSHWSLASDGGAGHCFPAGHAASGFTFVGGYFAFRSAQPQLARRWLAAAIAMGLVLGLAQQWRGAHFMSHTLWSACVCWVTAGLLDAAWPRGWTAEGI